MLLFLLAFLCALSQHKKKDSLNGNYVFFKTILEDTSDQSFLMRICIWDDPSQQFQLGFIPNKELYKYVSKRNSIVSLNQYFEQFYNHPEYGYKWNCFFLDQKYPEVAIVTSFYVPDIPKKINIKKYINRYFDSNGWLKEQYWAYWPQIVNYLYEKKIPVRLMGGVLPIAIRLIDHKKIVGRH